MEKQDPFIGNKPLLNELAIEEKKGSRQGGPQGLRDYEELARESQRSARSALQG